ncbi:MAG: protein kinase [Myxococcaceae bacterium]|nr:protein kinase [Myxococcaceae bacterium]
MTEKAAVTHIDEKYEVVRELGKGAMGSVYEARHTGTGRRVAIKLILEEMLSGHGIIERFEREARAAGAIDSPHITQVLDSGTDRKTGAPYLVMEFLAGEDLGALERRLRPLRPELALRIIAQVLEGLDRAHAGGVIHRDIKPPNLMVARKETSHGDPEYLVKLCDFGIAKVKADPLASSQNVALTHTSALLGSPLYMSPEQVKGAKDIDARSDVWSVGVVLYQLLTGSTPHPEADTLGLLLLAICSETPPTVQSRAPWVPTEVATIVHRAIKMDASARFQSAREMLDAVLLLLPDGTRVTESMLTPMTDEERAFAAVQAPVSTGRRAAPPTLDLRAVPELAALADSAAAASAAAADTGPSNTQASTNGAYARPGDGTARVATSRRPMMLGAVAVAALVGVVGFAMRSPTKATVEPPPRPSVEAPSAAIVTPLPSTTTAIVTTTASAPASAIVPIELPKPTGKASSVGAPRVPPSSKAAASTAPNTPATTGAAPAKSAPAAASSSPISRDFN